MSIGPGLAEALMVATRARVDRAASDVERRLAETAPRRTGAMADDTTVVASEAADLFSVTITIPAEYASFMRLGTEPHPIVGNPYLAFFWEKVGKFVVLRSVNHPGTKPERWLDDVLDDWASVLDQAA